MNIRDALLKAKEIGGNAVRKSGDHREDLHPFVGTGGAWPNRFTFNDYKRWFDGNGESRFIGYDSLVADDWEVQTKDNKII